MEETNKCQKVSRHVKCSSLTKSNSLFITLLLGYKVKSVLAKQLCCIQTKRNRSFTKKDHILFPMTKNSLLEIYRLFLTQGKNALNEVNYGSFKTWIKVHLLSDLAFLTAIWKQLCQTDLPLTKRDRTRIKE